nr:hypothetical protein [Tanacetum cinerariifolium]
MENTKPPPALDPPVLPTALRAKVVQELDELQAISACIDSRLENIKHFFNDFVNPPNETDMDDLKPNDESEITNRIGCRNFQENECEIFTVPGDGVRIFPDGVAPPDL